MACARHLNLNQLPIVCVNVDGYYEPFREMLDKAHEDGLIKLVPEDIVHFVSSAEEAIQWVEAIKAGTPSLETVKKVRAALRHKKSILRGSSFFSASPYQDGRNSFFSVFSSSVNSHDGDGADPALLSLLVPLGLTFAIGTVFGVVLSSSIASASRK